MGIEAIKRRIVRRFQRMRRRRPTAASRKIKSVRMSTGTYLLARMYAEEHDMTIRDAIGYLISVGASLVGIDRDGVVTRGEHVDALQ